MQNTRYIFLLFGIFLPFLLTAQVEESKVKAAYVFQLGQEINWPNQDSIKEYRIGLMTDDLKMVEHFYSISQSYKMQYKNMVVSKIINKNEIYGYNIIFIDEGFTEDIRQIANKTKKEATLIISYNSKSKLFFHLNLYKLQKENKIAFEVNRINLEEQGFTYSPDLLLLGGTMVDVKDLYEKTITELESNRDTLIQLGLKLKELNQEKKQSENAIDTLIMSIKYMNSRIVTKEKEYAILLENIRKKDFELENNRRALKEQFILKKDLEIELNEQLRLIEESQKKLTELNKQSIAKQRIIEKKNKEIDLKERRIISQSDQISMQRRLIIVSVLLAFVLLIVVGLIVHLLKYRKKISERLERLVEEKTHALSLSQRYYKSLFENSPVSLVEIDFDGALNHFDKGTKSSNEATNNEEVKGLIKHIKIKDINKRALNFYELDNIKNIQEKMERIITPTNYEFVKTSILLLREGKTAHSDEQKLYNIEGEEIYTQMSWVVVANQPNRKRLLLSIQDITKIKNNEIELQKHRDKLAQLVDEATGEVKVLNTQLVKNNKDIKKKNEDLILKNQEIESTLNVLKQTQSKLVDAEKMALLGMLTAGIAHEINNPLNYISAGSQALEMDYRLMAEFYKELKNLPNKTPELETFLRHVHEEDLFEKLDELFSGIHLGVNRVTKIVQALNSYSFNKSDVFEQYELNEAIKNSWTILGNKHRNKIDLIYDNNKSLLAECNVGKINQVFLNIFSNAIDAIPDKGSILIESEIDSELNEIHLSITDTGTGIDDEALSRAFAPFYTTKEVGQGTGLGLYISKGIMDQHQGTIALSSPIEGGATVEITLPINRN